LIAGRQFSLQALSRSLQAELILPIDENELFNVNTPEEWARARLSLVRTWDDPIFEEELKRIAKNPYPLLVIGQGDPYGFIMFVRTSIVVILGSGLLATADVVQLKDKASLREDSCGKEGPVLSTLVIPCCPSTQSNRSR